MDPDPGPAYILPELISGGNAAKSISVRQSLTGHDRLFGLRGRGQIALIAILEPLITTRDRRW
jgi:hypothetical protein